jgi:hypothetical protein
MLATQQKLFFFRQKTCSKIDEKTEYFKKNPPKKKVKHLYVSGSYPGKENKIFCF